MDFFSAADHTDKIVLLEMVEIINKIKARRTNPRLIGGSRGGRQWFGLRKAGIVPLIMVQSSLQEQ